MRPPPSANGSPKRTPSSPVALTTHDPDFEEMALFREALFVRIARDHPLSGRTSIRSEDLDGQAVLSLGPGHRLYEQVQALCEAFGATLISDYEGTNLDAIRQMVGMGMGISFFPALYVRSEMDNDHQVVTLSLANDTPHRTIGLVWRGRSPLRRIIVFSAQPSIEWRRLDSPTFYIGRT
ncbi:MAG: LysR substrate-binding domain-containing protein [Alphaproteobacteria bacterium]|nr:LysR substrate-binding domain-containing protein [Alphaproteobacteria bacterium]